MGESVRGVARWYGNERFRGPVGGQAEGWTGRRWQQGVARRGTGWGWLGGHHRG